MSKPLATSSLAPKLCDVQGEKALTTDNHANSKGASALARDKAKDDKHFNCTQAHEADYVAGLYPHAKEEVKTLLASACKDKTLHNSTHRDVYELIKRKLGYSQP